MATTASAEGLDDKTSEQINFFTRQYVDAMAPTNFALTNPDVLKKTLESKVRTWLRVFRISWVTSSAGKVSSRPAWSIRMPLSWGAILR